MDVFISWSGERSQRVAQALRDWLPLIIQSLNPWFSAEDIDKGTRWLNDLSTQLEKQGFGLVCITPENANSPWLLFESGALSKALSSSKVCPVLFGMEPTDIQGPLAQFQSTRASREDIRRLVTTMNKLVVVPLAESNLDTLYDVLWPKLEARFAEIAEYFPQPKVPQRPTTDVLAEILETVRSLDRKSAEYQAATSPDTIRMKRSDFLRWRQTLVELRQRETETQHAIYQHREAKAAVLASLQEKKEDPVKLMRKRDGIEAQLQKFRSQHDHERQLLAEFEKTQFPGE